MRKIGIYFFLLTCLIGTGNRTLFAQSEIVVEQGLNTLYEAVIANPSSNLVLKRGGDYSTNKAIPIHLPTNIRGETEPASDAPALIRFVAEPGEAAGKHLFDITADFSLSNVGLMGYSNNNQHIGAIAFINSKYVTFILDGCVIQGADQITETNGNGFITLLQKNNRFFNLVKEYYSSWGGIGNGWGGDSSLYQSYNNTFFNCGRIFNLAGAGPTSSEWMEHNTYCNTWAESYFPSNNEVFTVKNNIFYNTQIKGYVGVRMAENGDTIWRGDYSDWSGPGITDTLCGDVAIFPHVADSAGGDPREVLVTHNLKMYDQKVLDFYAANNVTPQTFFNVTGYKYANMYGWVVKDNILQENGTVADPEFAMGAIPESAYENMFKQRKEMSLPSSMRGPGFPYDLAWRPGGEEKGEFIWPLPFDLKPMNKALWYAGDDGYPLGDLNWFGPEIMKAWGARLENPLKVSTNQTNEFSIRNYPNPFCSSTRISYSIPKESFITLKVFDCLGIEMITLTNATQSAGNYEVIFNSSNLNSGIYVCRFQAGESFSILKMIIEK